MDKIKKYQEIIIALLKEYEIYLSGSSSEVKDEFLIDVERNHYQTSKISGESRRGRARGGPSGRAPDSALVRLRPDPHRAA